MNHAIKKLLLFTIMFASCAHINSAEQVVAPASRMSLSAAYSALRSAILGSASRAAIATAVTTFIAVATAYAARSMVQEKQAPAAVMLPVADPVQVIISEIRKAGPGNLTAERIEEISASMLNWDNRRTFAQFLMDEGKTYYAPSFYDASQAAPTQLIVVPNATRALHEQHLINFAQQAAQEEFLDDFPDITQSK